MSKLSASIFSKWSPAEILLAILFLLAPFYSPENIGGSGLRIPRNITVWIAAFLFMSFSLSIILQKKHITVPRFNIPLLLVPILITLSSFVAGINEPVAWFFKLIAIWAGYFFLLCLIQTELKISLEKFLLLISFTAIVHAVFAFCQVWYPEYLTSMLSMKRLPEGLFQHVNNQATYQATALSIALFLCANGSIKGLRTVKFFFATLCVVLSAFLVGMSGSRVGLLSVIMVIIIYLIYLWKTKENRKWPTLALVIIAIVGVLAGQAIDNRAIEKTMAMQAGYEAEMRPTLYTISAELILENPIFGHGLGSFGKVFQKHKVEFIEENPNAYINNKAVSHPHNEFLLWFVEGGAVAFLALLLLMILTIVHLYSLGPKGSLYLALLVPVVIHTQVEVPMYVSSLHYFLFLLLLAMVFAHHKKEKSISTSIAATLILKISVLLVGVASICLLVHTLIANKNFMSYYKQRHPSQHHLLQPALANPYLADTARLYLMEDLLYVAIKLDDKDLLIEVLNWTEDRMEGLAFPEFYYWMVNGYEHLNSHSIACDRALRGLTIFPRDSKLLDYVKTCSSS